MVGFSIVTVLYTVVFISTPCSVDNDLMFPVATSTLTFNVCVTEAAELGEQRGDMIIFLK